MTSVTEHLQAIVREGLAPLLRREGYKKTGHTWRKERSDCVQITSAQASDTDGGEPGKFTLNLGVYYPAADELGRGPPAQTKPLESHCVVHERIGFLMPAPSDHWWKVGPDTDAVQLGGEVSDAWSKYGKPWLEAHSDPAAAQEFLVRKGQLYWAAVFALYRQRTDEARLLLGRAVDSSKSRNPQHAAHVRAWGKTHGLL